jgi:hypothetical protein
MNINESYRPGIDFVTAPAPEDWGYARCRKCERLFDLLDGEEHYEWHHGHEHECGGR